MDVSRGYFSFSQFNTWVTSPKEYYKKYVLDNAYGSTKYQKFGKDLMDSLEFDSGKVDNIPPSLLTILKGYQYEDEIKISGSKIGSIKSLLGFVDAIDKTQKSIIEIKTGKHAWTEDIVKKNEQILFYAMLVNMNYGFIPTCKLVWVETRENELNGDVEFTGKVETFYRTFSISEVEKFTKKVLKAINDIADYDHEIISFDGDIDSRMLELLSEKKRIDDELDVLKSELLLSLKDGNTKYGVTDNFNITLAGRKTWDYSDELKGRIKDSAKDMKAFKTAEEKNGIATSKISEYILIKVRKD